MGFWHTGYIEFHEPTGIGIRRPSPPPRYVCDRCGDSFSSPAARDEHRFAAHPLHKPAMFVQGIELGARRTRIAPRRRSRDTTVLSRVPSPASSRYISITSESQPVSHPSLVLELLRSGICVGQVPTADHRPPPRSFQPLARKQAPLTSTAWWYVEHADGTASPSRVVRPGTGRDSGRHGDPDRGGSCGNRFGSCEASSREAR